MATVQFKYYMHDDATNRERAELIYGQVATSFEGTQDDLANILGSNRPFYEIELTCELELETGKVTIISAK